MREIYAMNAPSKEPFIVRDVGSAIFGAGRETEKPETIFFLGVMCMAGSHLPIIHNYLLRLEIGLFNGSSDSTSYTLVTQNVSDTFSNTCFIKIT